MNCILVDVEDQDLLNKYNWQIERYITYTSSSASKVFKLVLHKLIAERMGLFGEIDHIDRNILNCKRSNLRLCDRYQNMANKGISSRNKSNYKGVHFDTRSNKYRSQIRYNGVQIHLGLFENPIEAAKTYDKFAKDLHGEFAFLNFPESLVQ